MKLVCVQESCYYGLELVGRLEVVFNSVYLELFDTLKCANLVTNKLGVRFNAANFTRLSVYFLRIIFERVKSPDLSVLRRARA